MWARFGEKWFFHSFPPLPAPFRPRPFRLHQNCTGLISFRYYLDKRKVARDGTSSLKLQVNKRHQSALMPVAVRLTPEQWDSAGQRVTNKHPKARVLNNYLDRLRMKLEDLLRELILSGEGAPMSAYQVRDWIEARTMDRDDGILLADYYRKVLQEKKGSTRRIFEDSWNIFVRILPKLDRLPLASLDEATVRKIDAGLRSRYQMSSRNTYISKLTQVTKRAHAEGLIASNPGRVIHLHTVIPKSRALTVEQLRTLFAYRPEHRIQEEALALFRLEFYLRGMNTVDIARNGPDAIYNGRIRYTRAKTGRDYDFPVEPEAQELLDRWAGKESLFRPLERVADPSYYVARDYGQALRAVAAKLGLPKISMYWGRHSLASIMIETGTTMELVAGALGHSYGPRITAGYVTLQQRQVDEAVRRVYDLVAEDKVTK